LEDDWWGFFFSELGVKLRIEDRAFDLEAHFATHYLKFK
jgi:hypothetical protein